MSTTRHYPPALILFLLTPLFAEYLLGNIPLDTVDALAAYIPVTLLYGAGALIIRECAVRAGRGWPTIALLALAYGVIEEGTVTQSLFNPSYVGLALNDYGTIPGTDTGAPWALFVLTLHCVWSITVPIAVVHTMFPDRRRAPWLPGPALIVVAVLYLIGAAILAAGTYLSEDFAASPGQLAAAIAVAAVTAAVAFLLPRKKNTEPARAAMPWHPILFTGAALLAGSVFFLLYIVGVEERTLAPWAYVAVTLALEIGFVVAVWLAASRTAWTAEHTLGVAAGGVLTYAWAGIHVQNSQYGYTTATGVVQAALIIGAIAVLAVTARRTRDGADGRRSRPVAVTTEGEAR